MWPVMTLTLLLQLTDDEQLYAQGTDAKETCTEAPAAIGKDACSIAPWPAAEAWS